MSSILLATGYELEKKGAMLKGMFGLRHQVFYERLGWDVNSHDGMEFDEFDGLNPTYMVASDGEEVVEGCWRILPTTGPYMLKNVFRQLLRGEQAPVDEDIWELSRFAVEVGDKGGRQQAVVNHVTLDMIRSVYDHARMNGISSYVTVTSVAMERLMRQLGVPMRRFGDQKAVRIGRVLSVACWVDINDQFHNAVYPAAHGRGAV